MLIRVLFYFTFVSDTPTPLPDPLVRGTDFWLLSDASDLTSTSEEGPAPLPFKDELEAVLDVVGACPFVVTPFSVILILSIAVVASDSVVALVSRESGITETLNFE